MGAFSSAFSSAFDAVGSVLISVHCNFDGPSSGSASGRIRFECPYTLVGAADNSIVAPFTVSANLAADGTATVSLPATNDPQWTPTGWAYTVTATVGGVAITGTLQLDYQTTTVELADLLQVDGAAVAGTTYIPLSQKGVASGVASLDASTKVPVAQIPAIAISGVTDLQTQLDSKLNIPAQPYLDADDIANLVSIDTLNESMALKSSLPVTTVITASGNYADPGATCKFLDVTIVAPGGGGGSGRRGAAASVRSGGAGGGGGGLSRALIPYSAVTFPVSVTVGTAGTGGAAVAANDTGGNAGGNATPCSFGTYLRATGGGGGAGGSTGAASGGFSGGGTTFGQTGASSSATGGVPGNPSAFASGPTAGGAGGGITSGDSPSNGGAGGAGHNSTAGTAGVVGGAAAGTGPSQPANSGLPGNGGGGGAASITTAAGAGAAAGLYGAGGGGGGASLNGNASGAGGDGGAGIVRVVAFF